MSQNAMIVYDDEEFQSELREMLYLSNCCGVAANSSEQELAAVKAENPDKILVVVR